MPHKERMAWTSLRKQLKETGIKNPNTYGTYALETSINANATNGIEL